MNRSYSKFRHIRESNTLLESRIEVKTDLVLIKEDDADGFIARGYKDITSLFFSPEGVVYIPDGEYKGDGSGGVETVMTTNSVDTGYVFIFDTVIRGIGGTRGIRNSKIKVQKNGGLIGSTGPGEITKILLNEQILQKSGISTKN
jgi:hypothetical protein